MKPRTLISFAVIIALVIIASIVMNGCSARVTEPWKCECNNDGSHFECSGATIHTDFKN